MFTNSRRAISAACFLFVGACVTDVAPPPLPPEAVAAAEHSAAAETSADRIEADIRFLADDAREGREAGSTGYQAAADYVAARMEGIGLKPAGDNAWFQQVTLRAFTPVPEAAAMSFISADGEEHVLTHLEDFEVFPSANASEVDFTAPVVFLGYGVHAPEAGHDDYEGLDVANKIVVYFTGAPDIFDSEERAHYGGTSFKAQTAAERGAIGVISLLSKQTEARYPWKRVVSNPKRKRMTWVHPDGRAETSGPNYQGSAVLNTAAAALLFEGQEKSYEALRNEIDAEGGAPKAFPLDITVTMKGAITQEDVTSPNVIGLIPGADPALKDEYVVLTAHLDHTGVNERLVKEGKDGVNNGALDNAAGVATMLEAARRMKAAEAPARSVLFIALTAEEKGLLGADYFVHYPTVPPSSIVANVNLDMPLLLYPFTDVVAFGAERSDLGPIVARAAAKMDVSLSPDPLPEQGLFTRSDHYRFVEKGVPSVFLVTGFANGGEEMFGDFLKNHYHKPSDDLSLPILFDEAARFAELNYLIAAELADAPERPGWNEGDFFGELFGAD